MRINMFRQFNGLWCMFFLACQTIIPVADGAEHNIDTDTYTTSDTDSQIQSDTDSQIQSDTDSQIQSDTDSDSDSNITPDITGGFLVHRWRFNEDLKDDVGNSNAVIITPPDAAGGNAYLNGNEIYLTGGAELEAEWISLGTRLLNELNGGAITIELFATQWSVKYFSRIFEFGASNIEYLHMTWTYETNLESDLVRWWDESKISQLDTNAPYTLGQEFHIVMIVDPKGGTDGAMRITWYTAPSDSPDIGEASGFLEASDTLSRMRDLDCWLGKSHSPGDPVANASYNEVRIWSGALTQEDIAILHRLGPDM